MDKKVTEQYPPPIVDVKRHSNREFICAQSKLIFRQQLLGLMVKDALRSEGMHQLYRGLLPPLIQRTTTRSIMFGMYDTYKSFLGCVDQPGIWAAWTPRHALAAFLAGATEATLCPLERIQVLLQTSTYHDKFRNTREAFQVVRSYGLPEFYRGLSMIIFRNGTSNVLFFSLRGPLRDLVFQAGHGGTKTHNEAPVLSIFADFVSGAVLGASISTLFFPFNVVKHRMQSFLGSPFQSPLAVFRIVWRERRGSLKELFRGVQLNYTRSLMAWGLTNAGRFYLVFPFFISLRFFDLCWAESPIAGSIAKAAISAPSPWSPSQALKAQTAHLMATDSQPVFPPVRPGSSSSTAPCFPPPMSTNNPMTPIVTPASLPPPTPLTHSPQSMPGSPIEFPLLNESPTPPTGQVHHITTVAMGASTRSPEWSKASAVTTASSIPTSSPNRATLSPISAQPGPSFTGELQIAHPPTPNEREWVLTAGNESAIDNVLAISLMYGGRLVSMGFFYRGSDIYYYAIMHKYQGPVFLKPNPYTYNELMKVAKENEQLDLGLTQLCGQDNGQGKVTFSTYWEKVPNVSFRNRAQYVGVWMKPSISNTPYEAYYGLTLKECLDKDRELRTKGYVAVQFRVFNNANEILCAAIWDYQPRRWHTIEMGESLQQIHRNVLKSQTTVNPRARMPRQISHFIDADQRVNYVVLKIPATYLRGTENLLKPEQLDFIVKRVEHFMRDLDIPGLSVAISKDEKLKFAAGFGYGNLRKREQVTPANQFRVGSVSKPITAAAVLILVDQGKLSLDQRVFGPGSLFGGWNNIDSDPAWMEPRKPTRELISLVLENSPLATKPGRAWIYSNFGYQLLGYIIERISGMSYEEFVKKNVWDRAGVTDVQVARSTLSEKSKREVLYYMSGNRIGFSYLDGFTYRPDLLSEKSLREWIKPSQASNGTYGLGWSVNVMGFNGLVRLDNGLEMAVVVNKEYSERDFFHELGYILHHIGSNCDWWSNPSIDLFNTPPTLF
ncbi:Beta-lactamase domain-containing protein [Aphelenchoides besseyi]|nr:Beta-lactamase domain-containing protein [Aphelenchoides besseyi]